MSKNPVSTLIERLEATASTFAPHRIYRLAERAIAVYHPDKAYLASELVALDPVELPKDTPANATVTFWRAPLTDFLAPEALQKTWRMSDGDAWMAVTAVPDYVTLMAFDPATRHLYYVIDPKTRFRDTITRPIRGAHPLRRSIRALATTMESIVVHAAALTYNNEATLLVGPSGAGKSTLTWAATMQGATYLADDLVWLDLHDPAHPIAYPLYPSLTLTDTAIGELSVAGLAPIPHLEIAKTAFYILPHTLAAPTRLKTVVLLNHTDQQEPTIAPYPSIIAASMLVQTTLLTPPATPRDPLQRNLVTALAACHNVKLNETSDSLAAARLLLDLYKR